MINMVVGGGMAIAAWAIFWAAVKIKDASERRKWDR